MSFENIIKDGNFYQAKQETMDLEFLLAKQA